MNSDLHHQNIPKYHDKARHPHVQELVKAFPGNHVVPAIQFDVVGQGTQPSLFEFAPQTEICNVKGKQMKRNSLSASIPINPDNLQNPPNISNILQ